MPSHRGSRPARRSLRRRLRRQVTRTLRRSCAWAVCLVRSLLALVFALRFWFSRVKSSCQEAPLEVGSTSSPNQGTKKLRRPCLPDSSALLLDCESLSQELLVQRVVCALRTWASQIPVPQSEFDRIKGLLEAQLPLPTCLLGMTVDACMCRCVILCVFACNDPVLAKDLSHQLGLVTRAMADWMFPVKAKTKRKTGLELDRLVHMVGCIRMLLHTRWQATSGRCRKSWALKRLQCTHPDFCLAMFQHGPWSAASVQAAVNFLVVQLSCQYGHAANTGCLYLLCSVRQCYLGSTDCNRRTWQCTMRSPMARFYEHLQEIRSVKRTASYAKYLRKTLAFKHVHFGDLSVWVVAVTQLPMARALEQCFLRVGHWPANSQSTKAPAQAPRRHSRASRRSDRRPPPRFRKKDGNSFFEHAALVTQMAAKSVRNTNRLAGVVADNCFLRQAFDMNFHAAYWHVCKHRFALTGQIGPLDLRARHCRSLLACFVSRSKTCCWESIRQRWALRAEPPGCEAIVAMSALLEQKSGRARAQGIKACDRWLRQHGLPGTRKHKIRWPAKIPRHVFLSCLRAVRLALLKTCSPMVANWVTKCVQAVSPPHENYTKLWKHIPTCKGMLRRDLFDLPLDALDLQKNEGVHMLLCKKYWKTPIFQSSHCLAKLAQTSVSCWLRSFPYQVDTSWKHHLHAWSRSQLLTSHVDITSHLSYVADLNVPDGHVAVPEDKDKASCWTMPVEVYERLFVRMVNQDSEHWVRRVVSVADLVESYRLAHVAKLPHHLQSFCAKAKWRRWQLAYMYINVKSKCFQSGVGRICQKANHACCRRIVSWAAHPCRWMYKLNAKALEAVVRLWACGFETRDLFSAVSDLRAAVNQLDHNHGFLHCCYKCQQLKAPLCTWVGDAAQLFEEISKQEVLERLQHIVRHLHDTSGAFGVVTKQSRRLHFWLARNNFRPSHGARLHKWDDIITVTELALLQTCVKVGPVVYEQRRGVPIGGFMSKQCASIFLGYSESEWITCDQAASWCPPGLRVQQVVAATRYVDDLAMVSSVLCSSCMGRMVSQIYEEPIKFDAASPTHLGTPWLDVWLVCEGLNLRVHAHGAESSCRSQASQGTVTSPQKFRLMPFQGESLLDMNLLKGILNGRLNRLRSLDLAPVDLKLAVECDLQIWAIHGYPLHVTLRVWQHGTCFPDAVKHARHVLQQAIQTCGPAARLTI